MKRFLDALFTAMALVLAIPTLLILISWNAIPGDRLYSLKTGLEDVVLVVFAGTPLVPEVSMQFTDRRFNEATALLSKKGSTVGYDLLIAEAQQTQTYITEKNDDQSSVKFTENIEVYKKEIQKEKIRVQAQIDSGQETPASAPNPVPVVISVPTPTPVVPNEPVANVPQTEMAPASQTITVTVPTQVVITQENPVVVLQNLQRVEEQLDEIQQEVEEEHNDNSQNNNNNNNFQNNGNHNGNGGGQDVDRGND